MHFKRMVKTLTALFVVMITLLVIAVSALFEMSQQIVEINKIMSGIKEQPSVKHVPVD